MAAQEPSPALGTVLNRAERTTERDRELRTYYGSERRSAYTKKESPLSYEEAKDSRPTDELSFQVNEIKVTPSSYVSPKEIEKAIHFKGPGAYTVTDLNDMVDGINALYQEKGIMTAKAVLPPQKVVGGIVYIRLIEGKYGKTTVRGNHRITDSYIKHRIHTATGSLVDLKDLEESIERYNGSNRYAIRASVTPGEQEGTSDVELILEEPENPWNTILFVDNSGQVESGRYRLGSYSEYRGIGGGDAGFYIAPTWTEGIWGGSIGLDTPIGRSGTRMSLSYSRNIVHIIDGVFSDFNLKSKSNDLGLTVSHPLVVTPRNEIDVFLEGHRKWSDTTYAGMELSDNRTNTIKLGSTIRSYDRRGMWFGLFSVTGYDSHADTVDRTQGGHYYSGYILRRQALTGGQELLFRAYGQYSAYPEMPSTEQFTLGGMNTVRGYRESLLSGDKGWFTGLEYQFPVSPDKTTWRGILFVDHGVSYSHYRDVTKRYFLSSTGLGVEYRKDGWYGKVMYGIPIHHSEDIHGEHPRIHFYMERRI